ncbi:MAG TPA: 4Fe-4S dicluster domain-containing protein [Polyangiaceae bacterium]
MPPLKPIGERPQLDPGVPEFDAAQDQPPGELSRREFLYLSGATIALSSQALLGCTRAPAEKIIPYRVQPPEIVPGRALHYASASTLDGYGTGIVVESHEGRPTKIEGNPTHPASLGASSAMQQALLLELYDPRRLRSVTRGGLPASDSDLTRALRAAGNAERRGRGVHLVLGPCSSPLLTRQLTKLQNKLPELAVHFHAPLSRAAAWQGSRLAFGSTLETRVDLRGTQVVVAIDADMLAQGPEHLAVARAFAHGRRLRSSADSMNRLYVVETSMSVTGGMADHRLALVPSQMAAFAAALLREVALSLGTEATGTPQDLAARLASRAGTMSQHAPSISAIARDLVAHRGRGAVLTGDHLPAPVHAAAHAINTLLGNDALSYVPSPIIGSDQDSFGSLHELRGALAANAVESLIVFDTDIVYASAADLELENLLGRARESIYLGLFANQTSAKCNFRAPAAHMLESWLDTRSLGGTTSIVQPLLAPLYGGRTSSEVLAALLGADQPSAHDLLRDFWREQRPADFDSFWETTLARGTVENTKIPVLTSPSLSWGWLSQLADSAPQSPGIELSLTADTRLHDGRFGNNPWLLELPCPVTKQTWGNAALIAPALARRLGASNGQVLELTRGGRSVAVPALIVPGHADGALTLALGWGQRSETSHESFGVSGYRLMASNAQAASALQIRVTGRSEDLALSQDTMTLGDSADSILLSSTLADYQSDPKRGTSTLKRPLSMYASDAPESARQWGMTIDLNACTGCSACVVACQAENNIPSVGKSGVLKHREMHWLRVDRYVNGSDASPRVLVEPMACQHCEKAPCEYVCPTGATVHSSDGLNQMVYNRCVGTRFCSNNCPYKVRRFNWFDYHQGERSPRELAQNPEVTVRARGVMEKCSYCVQRIRKAEIASKVEHRPLADHEVRTACEQACPTEAIRFGDINDPNSEVAVLRQNDRAFQVLPELGAVPRTRYLMKLTNPNPELA